MRPQIPVGVPDGSPMNYRNTELKLDQIVGYLNDGKINLSPVFQRGHVWTVPIRRKLIANIVQGRPIPAIFLYKELASGAKYSYNILDGKQRLESLILFIGTQRNDLKIPLWQNYFFPPALRRTVSFWVKLPNGKRTFAQLDDETLANFREYSIPTVEITFDDTTTLDEIINLFVDINQQGVAVSRFQIVKAMGTDDALLHDVFELIALEQKRGEDVHYRAKSNEFTRVLTTLSLIENIQDNNAKIDRIWERLLEIVLFMRDNKHRQPVEVLKRFIKVHTEGQEAQPGLSKPEIAELRKVFRFLRDVYNNKPALTRRRLAADQTHFYTMSTALFASDLIDKYSATALTKKLVRFARIIDSEEPMPRRKAVRETVESYLEQASKQTTHVSRRTERQRLFVEAIDSL